MLINTSGTTAEFLSIQFYRISFLRLKILDEVLSATIADAMTSNSQSHRQNLQSWHEDWKCQAALLGVSSEQEAWAKLQYHESLLLLWKANSRRRSQNSPLFENQQICEHIVEACTTLLRHSTTSQNIFGASQHQPTSSDEIFFSPTWTTTHTVLSASLSLFVKPQAPLKMEEFKKRNVLMRRCLILMSSLEANANNMATGFTGILERFISDEEGD